VRGGERLEVEEGRHLLARRLGRPDLEIGKAGLAHAPLDLGNLVAAQPAREADALRAPVAAVELEAGDEAAKLGGGDVLGAGEQPSGGEQQGDVGVEAVGDAILGRLDGVLEARLVARENGLTKGQGRAAVKSRLTTNTTAGSRRAFSRARGDGSTWVPGGGMTAR
jgi:hypothetical protein